MNRIKKALQLLKTKSVLINWGLSYLFILLIPIIFGVYNTVASRSIILEEVERANDIVLEGFRNEVDGVLQSLKYTSATIISDDRFRSVATSKGNDFLWRSYLCTQFFTNHKISDPDLSLLLYMSEREHLISHQTANSLDRLYSALPAEKRSQLLLSNWKALFINQEGSGFTISPYYSYSNFGKNAFVYRSTLPIYKEGTRECVNLFVSHPCDSLSSVSDEATYAITDSAGNLLWSSQEYDGNITDNKANLSGAAGSFRFSSDGGSFMCNYIRSNEADWYYQVIMPMEEMHRQTLTITKNLLYTTLISLIVGIALMLWFVSRNYMPISEVLSAMNAVDFSIKGNEFTIIKEAYATLEKENSAIRTTLDMQRESIKEKYLLSLLVGRIDMRSDNSVARQVHETYSGKTMSIVSMRFVTNEMQHMALSDNQNAYFDIMSFAVNNVFAELLGDKFTYNRVHDGDYMVYVFAQNSSEPPISESEGMKAVEDLCEFLESKFAAELTVVIGENIDDLDQLAPAYNEVLEIFSYAKDAGDTGIILAKDHGGIYDKRYSQKEILKRRLAYSVENGDTGSAIVAAKQLMNEIIAGTNLAPRTALKLFYTIPERVLEAFSSAVPSDVQALENLRDKVTQLSVRQGREPFEKDILQIIKDACSYVMLHSSEQSSGMAALIISYIDKNYADENLNITGIAQALGISPKTVSHHFRRATSMGVLHYVNHVRITNAKEIALHQSVSIERLSQMVGYTSVKTFRRAFAKEEGITPGKFFRQMQGGKDAGRDDIE